MNVGKFKSERKKIFICCICYSLICEIVSLFVLGFDKGFLIGIVGGTVCLVVNFVLLECVVDIATIGKRIGFAFLIQLGRLLIYGAVGYGCFKISEISLIAFAIGVLGIVIAALITYGKEGRND